jgi:phosphoserine phosphatase
LLRLYLVRHGVTVWNREARWQGHTDVPLSAEGVEQAKLVAARLSREPITAVWSSDLARARHTAEAIAEPHALEVQTSELLRETMLGEWEGLTIEEIIARGDEELWHKVRHDSLANRPPGAERLEAVWDRIMRVRDLLREGYSEGTVVVAGHGGSLRALLCDALGAGITCMGHFQLDNASLSAIEYRPPRLGETRERHVAPLEGSLGPALDVILRHEGSVTLRTWPRNYRLRKVTDPSTSSG